MITELWTPDCLAIFADRKNDDDENIIIGIAQIDNVGRKWNRQKFTIDITGQILPEEIEQCKKIAMEFIMSKYWEKTNE